MISGGTGAIGRATARRLLAAGWSVGVASEVDWLVTAARGGQDADLIPGPGDSYFAPLLDYPAEDRWLAARMAGAG